MPSGERRPARAKRLVRHYARSKKEFAKHERQRKVALRRSFHIANCTVGRTPARNSLSSFSECAEYSSSDSEYPDWDNLFGPEWRTRHHQGFTPPSQRLNHIFDDDDALPNLLPLDGDASNSSSGWISTDGDEDYDSDMLDPDADDEYSDPSTDSSNDEDGENLNLFTLDKWARLRKWVLGQITEMYAKRYVQKIFYYCLNLINALGMKCRAILSQEVPHFSIMFLLP